MTFELRVECLQEGKGNGIFQTQSIPCSKVCEGRNMTLEKLKGSYKKIMKLRNKMGELELEMLDGVSRSGEGICFFLLSRFGGLQMILHGWMVGGVTRCTRHDLNSSDITVLHSILFWGGGVGGVSLKCSWSIHWVNFNNYIGSFSNPSALFFLASWSFLRSSITLNIFDIHQIIVLLQVLGI